MYLCVEVCGYLLVRKFVCMCLCVYVRVYAKCMCGCKHMFIMHISVHLMCIYGHSQQICLDECIRLKHIQCTCEFNYMLYTARMYSKII